MRKTVLALALAAAGAASAEMKIGVVDMMTLVRNHPGYDANKELLAATDKDYQKRLDGIKSEGESLQEEGRRLADQLRSPLLAAKAKADAETRLVEIQKKLLSIDQRLRSEAARCRQDLQDLEGRLLKTTTDDLKKRIAAFAAEKGYDLVVDRAAAPFAKAEHDATDDMLRAMNVDPAKAKGRDEGK